MIKIPAFKIIDKNKHIYAKILCPYCLKVHHHGYGNGSRISHCADNDNFEQYDLVCLDNKPPDKLEKHSKDIQDFNAYWLVFGDKHNFKKEIT